LFPVIVEEGSELTVRDLLELLEQPFWSETVTVYVPAEDTTTHCVVAPVLHR
jgi:hypothetical protein